MDKVEPINKIKREINQWIHHEDKKKRLTARTTLFFALVFSFAFMSAFTVHHVDQAIAGSEAVEIKVDYETKQDYTQQIVDFIQYDSLEKMTWQGVNEKRGRHYVEVFDGYVTNVFVFTDGQLTHYGTNVQGDLIPIDKL